MSTLSSLGSNSTEATQLAPPQPDTTPALGQPSMSGTTTITGTPLISLNASSQIPFKLAEDGTNFALWKSQLTNLLFGYDLLGFVDGTRPCPPSTDPAYPLWLRQDRLVLLGIQATVNCTIGPTINNCNTFADAWDKLRSSFANRSNTRMLTLLTSLMRTTKAGITVSDYMTKIKSLIDDLALIGHPMSDEEIISHTLHGLKDEFRELTVAVRVQDSTITFEDLYDKLLDEEMIQT